MSILIDKNTKVICQGFTGKNGTFHSEQAIAYGTKMVGGTSPGKGGRCIWACRCSRRSRKRATRPAASQRHLCAAARRRRRDLRSDPGRNPADHLHHRRHSGHGHGAGEAFALRIEVAPDRAELPGRHHAGRMQDRHHAGEHIQARQGRHRVALRHAHLRSRVPDHESGLGQTTSVGIGGDPVKGIDFIEMLEMFLADTATESIIMIGEIGGSSKRRPRCFSRTKPSVAARSR